MRCSLLDIISENNKLINRISGKFEASALSYDLINSFIENAESHSVNSTKNSWPELTSYLERVRNIKSSDSFDKNSTSISYALKEIEDLRDSFDINEINNSTNTRNSTVTGTGG